MKTNERFPPTVKFYPDILYRENNICKRHSEQVQETYLLCTFIRKKTKLFNTQVLENSKYLKHHHAIFFYIFCKQNNVFYNHYNQISYVDKAQVKFH